MSARPVRHTTAPDWILGVFDELDSKRYGVGLDVLTDDVEVQLGVHRWRGRETVRENLRAASTADESRHRIHQFWDGGSVKILRGEIIVTSPDTGDVATAAIGHFLDMDDDDHTRVRRWIGAFGPLT